MTLFYPNTGCWNWEGPIFLSSDSAMLPTVYSAGPPPQYHDDHAFEHFKLLHETFCLLYELSTSYPGIKGFPKSGPDINVMFQLRTKLCGVHEKCTVLFCLSTSAWNNSDYRPNKYSLRIYWMFWYLQYWFLWASGIILRFTNSYRPCEPWCLSWIIHWTNAVSKSHRKPRYDKTHKKENFHSQLFAHCKQNF